MPRSPRENQQIRDARRDEILRAARRVFAEKGFAHTKISDIASAAGVSHGLVFHYFASKEAMFQELIDEKMSRIAKDFDETGKTAIERLRRTLANSFCRVDSDPEDGQLMTQAMLIGGMPDAMRECAFKYARGARARMVELIRECQEDGEISDAVDPEQLTSVLICVFRGMSIRPPGSTSMPFPMPTTDTILRLLQPPKRGKREQRARKKD